MIDTILFDVDGVLLSEEGYFDASALAVWELMTSSDYLGLEVAGLPAFTAVPDEETIQHIRATVFVNETVLDFMKRIGINSNWDMVFLQLATQVSWLLSCAQRVRDTGQSGTLLIPETWQRHHLQTIGSQLRGIPVEWDRLLHWCVDCASVDEVFSRIATALNVYSHESCQTDTRSLWSLCKEVFQSWYLGNDSSGKVGFVHSETPLVLPTVLCQMLDKLSAQGIRLGIATGRQRFETLEPLAQFGWLKWFDKKSITTATEVVEAEEQYPFARLAKPNPFSYLRSYLQTSDAALVLETQVPLPGEVGTSVLVIGDSVADWMAARSAGFQFAAVLTGLTGQAARPQFEQLGCDFIWDDVSQIVQVIQ
jgi:phosphoglycolate phosphatase-like HAD superfamily hydrolase